MDQIERQIKLKADAIQRLNKDVVYYNKEIDEYKAKLVKPDATEDTQYTVKKQIAENERTINKIQVQMSTILDQLEEAMAKFIAVNTENNVITEDDKTFVIQNETYQKAVQLLQQLKQQYNLQVKEELIITA